MRQQRPDVHAGQIWVDRDKRMLSGNRRVRVIQTMRDGDKVTVTYRCVAGPDNKEYPPTCTSRYDRFQRAFDLVAPSAPGGVRP
jgi:predicted SnoaL-like aldol condensation-catalyzing enzyme